MDFQTERWLWCSNSWLKFNQPFDSWITDLLSNICLILPSPTVNLKHLKHYCWKYWKDWNRSLKLKHLSIWVEVRIFSISQSNLPLLEVALLILDLEIFVHVGLSRFQLWLDLVVFTAVGLREKPIFYTWRIFSFEAWKLWKSPLRRGA